MNYYDFDLSCIQTKYLDTIYYILITCFLSNQQYNVKELFYISSEKKYLRNSIFTNPGSRFE